MTTPTIPNGRLYFTPTLYTGNGSSQTITNTGFYPDFTWIKARSTAANNVLSNSVTGTSTWLISDQNGPELSAGGYGVTAFNNNGFTVGLGTSFNEPAGTTFVAWQWNAGNGSTSSNTNGSITSTVSVDTTAGFSILTYTGTGANATVGHGLGVTPSMFFIKCRADLGGSSWIVYHSSLSAGNTLALNSTSAQFTGNFLNGNPTSTVLNLGSNDNTNKVSQPYVAYCWAAVPGFSAFGSYTGNGSATAGTFVYLGFRPAYVMFKRTDSTSSWAIVDSSRDPYNLAGQGLQAQSSAAEITPASVGYPVNFLSNGFQLAETGDPNVNGGTYIYAAFAENPFKYANAR